MIYSTDGGTTWERLKLNLPSVRVTDLVIKDDDLVVGTNGRSIWIFDDLTPIRNWSAAAASRDVTLFSTRPAYRYRYSQSGYGGAPMNAGDNLPPGALLQYNLKSKPKGDVVLKVRDGSGEVLRTLTSKKEPPEEDDEGGYDESPYKQTLLPSEPGLHRVIWDLRLEGTATIRGARIDTGEPRIGPLVNPGTYTVELFVEGKTYTTRLEVKLDPRLEIVPRGENEGPDRRKGVLAPDELEQQLRLALQIRDEIDSLVRAAEQIRSVRKQLQARDQLLADTDRGKEAVKQSKALIAKLDELEEKLHNPKAKVSYDILAQKGGAKLYSQMVFLFDLIKDSDGMPNQGLREVHSEQSALLKKHLSQWQALIKTDIAQANAVAKKLDLPVVVVPAVKVCKGGNPAARKHR